MVSLKKRITAFMIAFSMLLPNAAIAFADADTSICTGILITDEENVNYTYPDALKDEIHFKQRIEIKEEFPKETGVAFEVTSENRKYDGNVDRRLELLKLHEGILYDCNNNELYKPTVGEEFDVEVVIYTDSGKYTVYINGEKRLSSSVGFGVKFTADALKRCGITEYKISPYKKTSYKKTPDASGKVIVGNVEVYAVGELTAVYEFDYSSNDLSKIMIKFNNPISKESIDVSNFEIESNEVVDIEMGESEASIVLTLKNALEYKNSYTVKINENFKDIYGQTVKEVIVKTGDIPLEARMNEFILMNISCRNVLFYGEKKVFDNEKLNLIPLDEYGNIMIPAKAFVELFGIETRDITDGFEFDYSGSVYKFINGKSFFKNNSKINYKSRTSSSCGEMLVALDDLLPIFGLKYETYDDGIIIISKAGSAFNPKKDIDKLKELQDMLIYTKTDRKGLVEAYKENTNGAHPRVLVPDSDIFNRIKSDIETDEALSSMFEKLKQQGDSLIKQPHTYYDNIPGLTQIQMFRKFRQYAELLGMLYNVTGDEKYAEWLLEETKIAARYDYDPRANGYLNAATLLMGFGISYDWIFNYMTDEERKLIRDDIINHWVMPGLEAHRGTLKPPSSSYVDVMGTVGWVTWNSNWNIICNAGLTVMAAAMFDEETELSAEIIDYALKSIKYYIPDFYPDGAALESLGYLTVIVSDFGRLMTTLKTNFGTTYGILDAPGISQMPYVISYLTGPAGIFNFADAGEGKSVQPAETMMYAHLLNDADLASLRVSEVEKGVSMLEVMDFIWNSTNMEKGSKELDVDRYFRVGETGSMRGSWKDSGSMFLSYHAGDNMINHSHMDTGTFILDAMGERWAIDLGSDSLSYSLNPASGVTSRWQLYMLRSEGHNTLTINPALDPGQILESFNPVIGFDMKNNGSYAIVDMTPAYANYAKKAHRGFMLSENRRVATVRDELELSAPSDVYWFMHTKADIELSEDGREAYLTQNGKTLYAKLDAKKDLKFTVMDAVPFETSPKLNYQASTDGIRKLCVYAPSVMKLDMNVSFTPLYANGEKMAEIPKVGKLSKWNVKGGESTLPYVDEITVAGEGVKKFDKEVYTYDVELPFDVDTPPEIAAKGIHEITLTQAEGVNDEAIVAVKNKVLGTTNQYTINFYTKSITGEPDGANRIIPVDVKVEGTYTLDDTSRIEYMWDGDLNTRFSIGKMGDMITFDLGEEKLIDYIGMSFYMGNQRQARYELYTSNDNENWTLLTPKTSTSGTTLEIETSRINQTKARYFRFVCYGTTAGSWFSPSEIAFYEKQ